MVAVKEFLHLRPFDIKEHKNWIIEGRILLQNLTCFFFPYQKKCEFASRKNLNYSEILQKSVRLL